MAKVIIVSRYFPAYHPRKGEPTFFVEKIARSMMSQDIKSLYADFNPDLDIDIFTKFIHSINFDVHLPKGYTIRSGKRWKTGDKASLRVWSGKPYRSKQIIIAPDVEVRVWDFEIENKGTSSGFVVFGIKINGIPFNLEKSMHNLATNDGLSIDNFLDWFKVRDKSFKGFSGQIICWDKNINY